jgi:adenosine deaminase
MDMNWIDRIPKVELHIHLEGAIPHGALWSLLEKYGGDSEVPTLEALKKKFVYKDFHHFIETWMWKNSFIREYEDFEFIAKSVAQDLVSQNIRYVEMFVSPPDFHKIGLETQRIIEAIWNGLRNVKGIKIALVPDLVRDFGAQKAFETIKEIQEVRNLGVIGIGLGGSEPGFPPKQFTRVYDYASSLGFMTNVHAGEASGPGSIWEAITNLKPDRIGHGTSAIKDESLLDYLVKYQIPVEVCPISNLKTNVVSSILEHPVKIFFDRGLLISINTDDPKMFGNSLALEYRTLVSEFGFSKEEIKKLIILGIQTSWLPENEKILLKNAFCNDPAW